MKQHFGLKNLVLFNLLPESWTLNGNIFLELFLGDLDEKITSTAKENETKKTEWHSEISRWFIQVQHHVQVL